jgi:cytidylate kinase
MTTGTTAKLLAEKLGFGYIDSGAMYRAVSMSNQDNSSSFGFFLLFLFQA